MLTEKQEMFAQEYLIDLNVTQAAIRAGYSQDTAAQQGCRLFKNVNVYARIQELQKIRLEKVQLSAEWVLLRLMQISDRCMQQEEVMKFDYDVKQMIGTGEYQFDSNGANKSTELIGKHLGMFKDKLEHSGKIDSELTVNLTPEKIKEISKHLHGTV